MLSNGIVQVFPLLSNSIWIYNAVQSKVGIRIMFTILCLLINMIKPPIRICFHRMNSRICVFIKVYNEFT